MAGRRICCWAITSCPTAGLFQNLRASRETELTAEFPLHVVCAWIGNSALIAQKHYLQMTESDYQRAACGGPEGGAKSGAVAVQKAVQSANVQKCQQSPETNKALVFKGFVQILSTVVNCLQVNRIPPRGLEPLS